MHHNIPPTWRATKEKISAFQWGSGGWQKPAHPRSMEIFDQNLIIIKQRGDFSNFGYAARHIPSEVLLKFNRYMVYQI
jgi:hypothetical protein